MISYRDMTFCIASCANRECPRKYSEEKGGEAELMDAIANELEIIELEEMSFDEDDGCAGGACKL